MLKKKLFTCLLSVWVILSSFSCVEAATKSIPDTSSVDIYGGLGLPTDSVPFMRKVRRGTLPNGLQYYILKNDKPENRAFLTLVVNAGSVLEEENERGISHFIEHMAFQVTKGFPKKGDILNYFQSEGMRFGADENAYTSFNETVYGAEIPVESDGKGGKRIPKKALEIIDDWTHAVTFDQKNIDAEKLVILEEKRLKMANVNGRILEKCIPIEYKGSKYAERLPIGLVSIIENATQSLLEGFYKKWYRTDNMAVILVGDFDDKALEKSLRTYFHAVRPKTALDHPNYEYSAPVKGNRNIEIITDPELSNAMVYLRYNQSVKSLDNSLSSFRQQLIDVLVASMILQRFHEESQSPYCPYIWTYVLEDRIRALSPSRFIEISAESKTNKMEKVIKALLKEKERICRYGWTESEIDVAKRELISEFTSLAAEKKHDSTTYVSKFVKYFTGINVSVADNDFLLNAANKILPNITIKEFNEAVKKYFQDDDLTAIIIAPEKEKIPSKDKIEKIIKASTKRGMTPPKEEEIDDILLKKTPQHGKILSETIDAKTDAIIWALSNGASVILKKTDNKTNEIVMDALAKGGTLDASQKDVVSARLAGDMFNVSGVGKYSNDELSKKLADKQVSLCFNISNFTHSFSGYSANEDIKTLFELLYLDFTQPRLNSTVVKAYISKYKSLLKNEEQNPQNVFFKDFEKLIYDNDPYFKPLEFSDIDKFNKSTALKLIKKFLNPQYYTFVFVGSIDVNIFREYVETYLASIPVGKQKDILPKHKLNRPGEIKHDIYKGKEEFSSICLKWIVDEQYSQKGDAIANVLGEYLDIVLIENVRMKLSNTYNITNYTNLEVLLGELSLEISFSCDPKKVDESIAVVIKDVNNIAIGNIDKDILNKAKKACQKVWESLMQENAAIARCYANLAVIYNIPFGSINEFPKLYDSVSSKDLQEMVRKVLKGGCTQAILYPEKLKE
ncbi:MAG: insulinase family protein [Endomicrobium sp.]|jgi:zinc protease|nr:insulinase family protein [Endomicrobium sp.]